MLRIIMADWAGYPLVRSKRIGDGEPFQCGILPLLDAFSAFDAGVPIKVTLVVSSEEWSDAGRERYQALSAQFDHLNEVIFRDNSGYDLGSYDVGLKLLRRQGHDGRVIFVNSSSRPPDRENWALDYDHLMTDCYGTRVGLCGIAMTTYRPRFIPRKLAQLWPKRPHVQSYFLYTDMEVLSRTMPDGIPGRTETDKRRLIYHGETAISAAVLRSGFAITSRIDPTIFRVGQSWNGKLAPGFRKSLLYRDQINKI